MMGELWIGARGWGQQEHSFRFVRTLATAALITPVVRSHSFRDNAAVMARRILGRTSTSSFPRSRRARVVYTPCASASSKMSCKQALIARDIERRSRMRRRLRDADADGAAECSWMWMIGEVRERLVTRHGSCARSPAACSGSMACFADVDALQGGGREERRDGGREDERGPLVTHDDTLPGEEITRWS